jgi:hypothetical protein
MTNNPIRSHTCSHCGTTGNGYITFDNTWEFNCYCCSKVDILKPNEIPQGVDKRYYSINVLKTRKVIARKEE